MWPDGVTTLEPGAPAEAGWAGVGWQVPPICAIGLVFYSLAWRTTRRMQVNA